MIRLEAKPDFRGTLRAFKRMRVLVPKVTAQELNRQRDRRSRTVLTDLASRELGVKPKKLVRDRIKLPKGGRATPRRLVATGLGLIDQVPASWFAKGRRGRGSGITLEVPQGGELHNRRATSGQPFGWKPGGGRGRIEVFRRVEPTQRRTGSRGQRTRLPIEKVKVQIPEVAHALRVRMLTVLAREWPATITKRLEREFRKLFGA